MCVVRDDADWEARTNAMGETTGSAPQPDMSNERIDSAKNVAYNRNPHGECRFVPGMWHLVRQTRVWAHANRYSGTLHAVIRACGSSPPSAWRAPKRDRRDGGCAHCAEDWSRIASVGSVTTTATDQASQAQQRSGAGSRHGECAGNDAFGSSHIVGDGELAHDRATRGILKGVAQ